MRRRLLNQGFEPRETLVSLAFLYVKSDLLAHSVRCARLIGFKPLLSQLLLTYVRRKMLAVAPLA